MMVWPRARHPGLWSQMDLRKHHYEQSYWRWWNSSWAISNPKRWCCESVALNMPTNMENSAVVIGMRKAVLISTKGSAKGCPSSIQLLSHFWLFATSLTAARQASLSITNSLSSLKLVSIESVMSSNHLIPIVPLSSCFQSFPGSGSFPMSQFFTSGGQSIEISASVSVLPKNIQDWFHLGWTSLIPLPSKRLSRVFCNTTNHKHQFLVVSFKRVPWW